MNERKDCEGKNGSWFILVFSALAITVILIGMSSGCSKVEAAERKSNQGFVYRHKGSFAYEFEPIYGDGHLWMFVKKYGEDYFTVLHHPDCACGKGGK